MMVVFLLGSILHISQDNNPKIFCAKTNDGFSFLVIDSDEIYDIAPNVNKKSKNKREGVQNYVDSISNKNIYQPFLLHEAKFTDDFNLAISESYPDINYLSDEKMRYDISIDYKGRVISNISYSENKKGGYKFVLDDNDLKALKKVINSSDIQNVTNNHFVNNQYNIASIIINKKVISRSLTKPTI